MASLSNAVLLVLPLVSLYFAVSEGVSLGAACTNNANCTMNHTNSECKSGTCQCTKMYFQQNNTCVAKKVLGAPCNATNQCQDGNATCKGSCTCNESFYPDTTCKPRIYPNNACGTPMNASCVANAYCNSTNFCVCGIGYTATTTSCNSALTMAVAEISTIIMCFMLAYLGFSNN